MSRINSPALIATAVAVVGLAFLGLSLILTSEPGWWENVLIEIGATLLLFGVLVWLGRHVEKKLDEVQVTQRVNQSRIDDLTEGLIEVKDDLRRTHVELAAAVVHRVQADRQADVDDFKKLASEPSREEVIAALERAAALKIPVPSLQIPNVQARIQLSVAHPALITVINAEILNQYERQHGKRAHIVQWQPSESTEEFLYKIAKALIERDLYPGDKNFELPKIFATLGTLLTISRLNQEQS